MRKTSLIVIVVVAVALAAAVAWYSGRRTAAPPREPAPGAARAPAGQKLVPAFSLPDINGNRVDSSIVRGKPAVVNIFATWCPPCREETPGLVAVYEKYKARGFELVGISLDTDTRGDLARFVVENRITYRVLLGDMEAVQAFGGGSAIPVSFFIGRDGMIRNVHVGFIDREPFDREVQKLL